VSLQEEDAKEIVRKKSKKCVMQNKKEKIKLLKYKKRIKNTSIKPYRKIHGNTFVAIQRDQGLILNVLCVSIAIISAVLRVERSGWMITRSIANQNLKSLKENPLLVSYLVPSGVGSETRKSKLNSYLYGVYIINLTEKNCHPVIYVIQSTQNHE